jgi:hypothetical protein
VSSEHHEERGDAEDDQFEVEGEVARRLVADQSTLVVISLVSSDCLRKGHNGQSTDDVDHYSKVHCPTTPDAAAESTVNHLCFWLSDFRFLLRCDA